MGNDIWRATWLAMLLGPMATAAQQLPAPADAPAAGSAQGDVSVTIYNNDVALVQDSRQPALSKGRMRQSFPDVSAAIRPETVSLGVPDAAIVEQNFDYDLPSPSSLMEKAVGESITLVRTNPATGAETRDRAKGLCQTNVACGVGAGSDRACPAAPEPNQPAHSATSTPRPR